MIGANALLCARGRHAEDQERDGRRDVGVQDVDGRHAADPHHRRRRVADHAARPARIRSRDDRGEVADAHAAAEQRVRHRAADQRRGDVVEEGRTARTRSRAARSAPVQSSGRKRGNTCGRPLPSKCAASSAKPTSSRNRFARITHSWAKCAASPAAPGPAGNDANSHFLGDRPRQARGGDRQRPPMEERDARERHAEDQELDRQRHQPTCGQSQSAAAARQPPSRRRSRHGRARSGPGAHRSARRSRARARRSRSPARRRSRTGAAPRRSRGPGSSRGRTRRRRRSSLP